MTPSEEIARVVDEQMSKIRTALQDRMSSAVARATGLHVNTVRAIKKGNGPAPVGTTIKKLEAYLFAQA